MFIGDLDHGEGVRLLGLDFAFDLFDGCLHVEGLAAVEDDHRVLLVVDHGPDPSSRSRPRPPRASAGRRSRRAWRPGRARSRNESGPLSDLPATHGSRDRQPARSNGGGANSWLLVLAQRSSAGGSLAYPGPVTPASLSDGDVIGMRELPGGADREAA